MKIDSPAPEQLPQLRGLWQEAFGDTDAFLDSFFRTGYSSCRCRCVSVDGSVAGALYWFDVSCGGMPMAYLYAIATGERYRNRGLCRALMADTHRHLVEAGYAGALLVPEDQALRRMYQKMGYQTATQVREFVCAAGPYPAPMRRIDITEYAALRRRLLPEGSVLQEGENLEFLGAQAELYAGLSFLLAARKNGDFLTGLELLGNIAAAPGILSSLGCSQGSFRAPGTGTPFAMFLPLAEDVKAPAYFGLAFD